MKTRVKMCGITRLVDAQAAIEAGVDALGFVFYPPSPRYIEPEKAAEIIAQIPAFINCVGLFVNEQDKTIENILIQTQLDLIQFHGDESHEFCKQFSRPFIKAIRMKDEQNIQHSIEQYPTAKGILLDSYVKGVPGGTGEIFNWDKIPDNLTKPIILAGGLSANNIAQAIKQVNPYAVDVSGGIEAHPGVKSDDKINEFMRQVYLTKLI
ncbi:MAG: phosphoribosylanthranilate isomerase [Gammaproteobacteria bacterium]|nr:phosphoribosylanthranilate isomerase [Gammaproteobacteria bacterium]